MDKYTLTLKSVQTVADQTGLFIFDKPEGFTFKAGQYTALQIDLVAPDPRGNNRAFSLASAPFEGELHFAMRRSESNYKKSFFALQPGDTVLSTRAVGAFVLSEEPSEQEVPVVLIIGGIGITPARSMIREAIHQGSKRKFYLFYSNRFQKDAAFHEEFLALPSEQVVYVNALTKEESPPSTPNEERGYIRKEMVEKYVPDIVATRCYIVGSPEFSTTMKEMLIGMGVAPEHVKLDTFTGLHSKNAA